MFSPVRLPLSKILYEFGLEVRPGRYEALPDGTLTWSNPARPGTTETICLMSAGSHKVASHFARILNALGEAVEDDSVFEATGVTCLDPFYLEAIESGKAALDEAQRHTAKAQATLALLSEALPQYL